MRALNKDVVKIIKVGVVRGHVGENSMKITKGGVLR